MAYSQKSRLLSLSTPLGEDKLLLTGFTGQEGLTRPSRFTLDTLVDLNDELDLTALLGAPVNFDVELDEGGFRVFNGIISKVIPKGVVNKDFRRCQLHVITQLDMLKRSSDHRIFEKLNAKDILTEIFDKHGVIYSDLTNGSYPNYNYYVQYGETDFDFVHRVLKETGINYWVQHETGKHTITLFDQKSAYRETTESCIEYVDGDSAQRKFYNWNKDVQLNTGKVMQRSFDYMRPLSPVQSQTTTLATKSAEDYEHYVYPALHNLPADSDSESQRHMEMIEGQHEVASVSTTCRSLEPGQTFSFDKHVIDSELTPSYVVTKIDYVAVDDTYLNQDTDTQKLESHLTCIPKENNFRRQKHYPRPTVRGVQTAIVVGPKGEEINTDELGRVQVQFHWDRQSKNSNWIRVAQAWADQGFGEQYIPRIGNEVMVHFEDGDINKPVIMGSLYNGKNKPAYSLPENKTQSGIKTRSSKGADPAEFNELRFEDKKGQEEFTLQAQKHQTTLIKDSQSRAIGNNQTASVGSSRYEVIKESRQTINAEGYDNLQVEKDISIHSVAGGIVAQAKNFIEFRAGGSTFTLNKNGTIVINGTLIDIDGTSAVNINGGSAPAQDRLDAAKVDKVFTTPTESASAIPKITVMPFIPQQIDSTQENTNSRKFGLGSDKAIKEFICRSKQIIANFNSLEPDERIKAVEGLINKTLTSNGIPKLPVETETAESMGTTLGYFSPSWKIAINDYYINCRDTDFSEAELTDLLDTAYHETAHAEQNWLAMKFASLPDTENSTLPYRDDLAALAAEQANSDVFIFSHEAREEIRKQSELFHDYTYSDGADWANTVYKELDEAKEKISLIEDEIKIRENWKKDFDDNGITNISSRLNEEALESYRNDLTAAKDEHAEAYQNYKYLPGEVDSREMSKKMLKMRKENPNLCDDFCDY